MAGVVVGAVYVLMGATLTRPSDKNRSPDEDTRSEVEPPGLLSTQLSLHMHARRQ